MSNRTLRISILIFFGVLVYLILNLPQSTSNHTCTLSQTAIIKQINNKTANILQQLVKTKYFRLIRLNLNSQCPLPYMHKLCKSKSCSVCRCDEKDIPRNWIKTDKVQSTDQGKDVWSQEREVQQKWVWHVQDQENDKGEYFDINLNVESFSGYNGSYIWSLIYEENCFKGANHIEEMCLQQQVLYKIISGLHTSISSHLSRLYKNVTKAAMWADKGDDDNFFFNHVEYNNRVLSHPERIRNLLFLYELLIRSVKHITPKLENYLISSQNISQDLQSTKLLNNLLEQIKKFQLKPLNQTDAAFFQANNYHVKQYQRYIHNISSILNCIDCEKCRLFGKMQTYGLGTALKVLLGYNAKFKRNQLVAMFNTLNKISISVNTYFNYKNFLNEGLGGEKYKVVDYGNLDLLNSSKCPQEQVYNNIKIWTACGIVFLTFIWVVINFNSRQKIKKQFKHAFPPSDPEKRS